MEQNSGARLNQPTAHLVTGGQREPGLRLQQQLSFGCALESPGEC